MVHASVAGDRVEWYLALRCGECGVVFYHVRLVVASILLHLRVFVLGSVDSGCDVRGDDDRHDVLSTVQ